jgi:hypothetical protein
MKLIDHWKTVLGRAWSSRLIIVSAVLQFAPAVLPFFGMLPDETRNVLPGWVFTVVPVTLLALALVARIVEQPKLRRRLEDKEQRDLLKKGRVEQASIRREKRKAAADRIAAEEKLLIEKMAEDTGTGSY